MIKGGKYRFVLRALTVSFLSSTVLWAKSDQELATEIRDEYQSFSRSKSKIIAVNKLVSPVILFASSLAGQIRKCDNREKKKKLVNKLMLVIARGESVGGISKQKANDAERKIIFTCINEARNEGAIINDFVLKQQVSADVKAHQQYIKTVLSTPGSINTDGYGAFNRRVKARYAVNNRDYRELERDIGKTISNELSTIGRGGKISNDRQMQLIESLLTVQADDRNGFLDYAQELLFIKNDQYQQEALNYLTKLKTNDERRQFISLIEELDLWKKNEKTMCLEMQKAAAAASLIKPEMSQGINDKIVEYLKEFRDDATLQSVIQSLSRMLSAMQGYWNNDTIMVAILNQFNFSGSEAEREAVVRLISSIVQLPDMDTDNLSTVLSVMNGVGQENLEEFAEHLFNILFDLTKDQRKQVINYINFAAGAYSCGFKFVKFIDDNDVDNIDHIALLAGTEPEKWRTTLERLRQERGRLGWFQQSPTEQQIYAELDKKPSHINREKLKQWKAFDLAKVFPDSFKAYTLQETQAALSAIVNRLNLTDSTKSNYVSTASIDPDIPMLEATGYANKQQFDEEILPKLTQKLKTIWSNSEDDSAFAIHKKDRPTYRRAITYIFNKLLSFDQDSLAVPAIQLMAGLLHCNAGNKVAIETLIQTFLSDISSNSESFETKLKIFLAARKENTFVNVVLTADRGNNQNAHAVSYYKEQLKDKLGLSSIDEEYKEYFTSMATRSSLNKLDVIKLFYDKFTPKYLIKNLYNAVQTKEDYQRIRETVNTAGRAVIAKSIANNRPFTPTEICDDLIHRLQRSTDDPNWWTKYFSADPSSGDPFELTKAGARQYLIDDGILLEKAK